MDAIVETFHGQHDVMPRVDGEESDTSSQAQACRAIADKCVDAERRIRQDATSASDGASEFRIEVPVRTDWNTGGFDPTLQREGTGANRVALNPWHVDKTVRRAVEQHGAVIGDRAGLI